MSRKRNIPAKDKVEHTTQGTTPERVACTTQERVACTTPERVACTTRLVECTKDIVLKPCELGKNLVSRSVNAKIIQKLLDSEMNKCYEEYGFVLDLVSIENIGDGIVDEENSGTVKYHVKYTIRVLKPEKNEVVVCDIVFINAIGFFATNDPLQIHVPIEKMPDEFQYIRSTSENDKPYFQSMKDEKKTLCVGDKVLVKIVHYYYRDDALVYLGKLVDN